MVVLNPLRIAPSAPTVCTSLQTLSHLRQKMHLSMFRTIDAVTSLFRWESSPPLKGISLILKRSARFCSSQSPAFGQVRHSLGWSDRMALVGMVGQDEFGHYLAGVHHPQRAGPDHHILGTSGSAGRCQVPPPFYFHHTYTAGRRVVLDTGSLQVDMAQCRDVYPYFLRGLKYGRTLRDGHEMMVYLECYLFFFHCSSVFGQ